MPPRLVDPRTLQPKVMKAKQERAPHQHDHLCIETSGIPGQQCCWCRCPKCWQNQGVTRIYKKGTRIYGGEPKGRCICMFCPCVAIQAEAIRICSMPVRSDGM